MKEEFRNIKGIPGYLISSTGKIWSEEKKVLSRWGNTRVRKGKFIKTFKAPNGYIRVQLYIDGTAKKFLVHRLVAETWVEGYFEGAVVDHINNIKDDNRSINLRWTTTQRNAERGSARYYTLSLPDGQMVFIYNLSKYCRTHGLSAKRLQETARENKTYKGMRLYRETV